MQHHRQHHISNQQHILSSTAASTLKSPSTVKRAQASSFYGENNLTSSNAPPPSAFTYTKVVVLSNLTTEKKGESAENKILPQIRKGSITMGTAKQQQRLTTSVAQRKKSVIVDLTQRTDNSLLKILEQTHPVSTSQKRILYSNLGSNHPHHHRYSQRATTPMLNYAISNSMIEDDNLNNMPKQNMSKEHHIISPKQVFSKSVLVTYNQSSKPQTYASIEQKRRILKSQNQLFVDQSSDRQTHKFRESSTFRKDKIVATVPKTDFDSTQVVHFQAQQPLQKMVTASGLLYEPSPIRKFNEEELATFDMLRKQEELQTHRRPPLVLHQAIFTPDQQHSDQLLKKGKLLSSERTMGRNKENSPISGSKRIRDSREHDDEIMAASPYKTPRGGDSSKKHHRQAQETDYRYQSGEEDVPPTSSIKNSACKILQLDRDQRFQTMRQLQCTLISSLKHTFKCSQRQPNRKPLSNITNQYARGQIQINESANSSGRCCKIQGSPAWKQYLFCCAPMASQNLVSSSPASLIFKRVSEGGASRNIQVLQHQLDYESSNQLPKISSFLSSYDSIPEGDGSEEENLDEYAEDTTTFRDDVHTNVIQHHLRQSTSTTKLIVNQSIVNNQTPGGGRVIIIDSQGPKFQGTKGQQAIQKENESISPDKAAGLIGKYTTKIDNLPSQQQQYSDSLETDEQENDKIHYAQVIAALRIIKKQFRVPPLHEIEYLRIELPKPDKNHKKKTIIFDLDETLVHCINDLTLDDTPDVILSITFPEENETVNAGFNLRPYLFECLREANKLFQVGVFTASHRSYADAVLDYIDPDGTLFAFRLYREHCFRTPDGYYVKDLRIFRNLPLKDVVIIDNSVYSFAYQLENGVPIIPYYNDKEGDEELFHLITYMQGVYEVDDVREYNREAFSLVRLQMEEDTADQEAMSEEIGDGIEEAGEEDEEEDAMADTQKKSSLKR